MTDPAVLTLRDRLAPKLARIDTTRLMAVIAYPYTHRMHPHAAQVFFDLADAAGDELMGRCRENGWGGTVER